MVRLWSYLRRVRKLLRGSSPQSPWAELRLRRQRLTVAYWIVRAFYLLIFYDSFRMAAVSYRWVSKGMNADPLWVVAWSDYVGLEATARILGLGFMMASLLCVGWPHRRWARILVALFALNMYALTNSFGAMNHGYHYPLWLAIIFCALPDGDAEYLQARRVRRESFLAVFFLSQFAIAFFYTLSGVYKTVNGFFPREGTFSSFDPEALAYLIIERWLQTDEHVFFETFFAQNLWLGWPAFLAVIYLELFAVVAVFRPQLHFFWGTLLACFHLGIWLLMGIKFPYQPVIVAMLFMWSPFAYGMRPGVVDVARQLPLFGGALAIARRSMHGPMKAVGFRRAD